MTELHFHYKARAIAEASTSQAHTVDLVTDKDVVVFGAPSRNQWWDVWEQFKTHKGAVIAAAVFSITFIGVAFGSYLWRASPTYIDFTVINQGPTWAHPLGTDQ